MEPTLESLEAAFCLRPNARIHELATGVGRHDDTDFPPAVTPGLDKTERLSLTDSRWRQAREAFLEAVAPSQRGVVARLLTQRHEGGHGLREWFRGLVWERSRLPASLPSELVQVYLDDPEALPLYDCADCGLAIPVRPDPQAEDGEAANVYFPECPCCGGATDLYAYWSKDRGTF